MSALDTVLKSKVLWSSAGTLVAATLLIGFMHTAAGRPLLALLRGVPGCPVSLEAADPVRVERSRATAAARRSGDAIERSRHALGFELGGTRRDEVLAYLSRHGVECESQREGSVLRCNAGPSELSPEGAPPIDDLHLQFDPEQRLVAIDLWRAVGSSCAALSWLNAVERNLDERVGPATARRGQATAAWLEAGTLRRTALEYRYRGIVAEVSATRFGGRGVRVRERYQWVPPTTQRGA